MQRRRRALAAMAGRIAAAQRLCRLRFGAIDTGPNATRSRIAAGCISASEDMVLVSEYQQADTHTVPAAITGSQQAVSQRRPTPITGEALLSLTATVRKRRAACAAVQAHPRQGEHTARVQTGDRHIPCLYRDSFCASGGKARHRTAEPLSFFGRGTVSARAA